jgi:hypothetical protein
MDKIKASKKEQKKSSRRSSKTSPSQQKIVEYSDVSSNELSTPEQGEIPSDGLSVVSEEEITPGPATIERNMHHSSIYEPIDDDDDELVKNMGTADRFSDSLSDSNKKRKKTKKKLKKGKKSKKKKKRRRHSTDNSVESISDEETLKDDEPATPPLEQVSYTPKHKYKASSPSIYCHINDSPNSIISDDKKEYSSPHTPPMPKKVIEESSKGRNSSLSSTTSNKISSKKRRASPERSTKDYRVRGGRSRSPYEYESRRYVERERTPYRRDRSPYSNSHKYRERRRRSR